RSKYICEIAHRKEKLVSCSASQSVSWNKVAWGDLCSIRNVCTSDRNSNNSIPTINTHGWHTHTHTRAILISIYISANAHRHTHAHERRPTEINTNLVGKKS